MQAVSCGGSRVEHCPYSYLDSSYNRINGTQSCENADAMNRILKGELGFQGLLVGICAACIHLTISASVLVGSSLPRSSDDGRATLALRIQPSIPLTVVWTWSFPESISVCTVLRPQTLLKSQMVTASRMLLSTEKSRRSASMTWLSGSLLTERLPVDSQSILTPYFALGQHKGYPSSNYHKFNFQNVWEQDGKVFRNEHINVQAKGTAEFIRKAAADSTV